MHRTVADMADGGEGVVTKDFGVRHQLTCKTCDDKGLVPATPGRPENGPDRCPDCGPAIDDCMADHYDTERGEP